MDTRIIRCTVCGLTHEDHSDDALITCEACGNQYLALDGIFLSQKTQKEIDTLANLRVRLSEMIKVNDAKMILSHAQDILKILPEDFLGSYFYAYGAYETRQPKFIYQFFKQSTFDTTPNHMRQVTAHMASFIDIKEYPLILNFIQAFDKEYVLEAKKILKKRIQLEDQYAIVNRDVFICHRSTDFDTLLQVVEALENDGFTCWYSERNLRPDDNENYWKNIEEAIDHCNIFLVISSQSAMLSKDVQRELQYANKQSKNKLEYKIDDSFHTTLFKHAFDGLKWIDASKETQLHQLKKRVYASLHVEKTLDPKQNTSIENQSTLESLHKRLQIEIKVKNIIEAKKILKAIKSIDPEYEPYWLHMIFIDFNLNSYDELIDFLDKTNYSKLSLILTNENVENYITLFPNSNLVKKIQVIEEEKRITHRNQKIKSRKKVLKAFFIVTFAILALILFFPQNIEYESEFDSGNILYLNIYNTYDLPKLEKEGYTFLGFYDNPSFFGKQVIEISPGWNISKKIYAAWRPVRYNVTFQTNSEFEITNEYHDIEINSTDLPIPTKTGHTFLGWFLDKNFISPFSTMPAQNITLYAKWQKNVYFISFITNTDITIPIKMFEYGSLIEINESLTKLGYTFEGWFRDVDYNSPFEFVYMPDRDLNIYGKWRINQYNLTYQDEYGNILYNFTLDFGESFIFNDIPVPGKDGYNTSGWFHETFDLSNNQMPAFDLILKPEYISKNEIEIPTFDDILNQTVDVGSDAQNWEDLLKNLADNETPVDKLVITVEDNVNYDVPGTYNVTITVTDESDNVASVAFTVTVVDNVKPVISLVGQASVSLIVGESFTDPGATFTDNVDGTGNATVSGSVNAAVAGTYTLTYSYTDAAGNAADPVTRTVTVIPLDTQNPVITLTGDAVLTVEAGATFTDPGATFSDNLDGTGAAIASGSVDTSALGSYTLTYNFTDAQGNAATPVTRTVNVVDTTAPVITVTGGENVTVQIGETYTELGASFTDNLDAAGNATVATTSDTVDTSTVGTYTITYTVTDSAGNISTAIRTITVIETHPVMSISDALLEAADTIVTVEGYITMNIDGNNFFIQDQTGAIDIFAGGGSSSIKDTLIQASLNKNLVLITAKRGIYRGLEQLQSIEYISINLSPEYGFPIPTIVNNVSDLSNFKAQIIRLKNLVFENFTVDEYGNVDFEFTLDNEIVQIRWDSRAGEPKGIPLTLEAGDVIDAIVGVFWSDGPRLRIDSEDDFIFTVENNGETIDFGDILVPSSSIRVWMDDENGEYMAAVIEEFNKVYPNIVVEFQHMGSVDARELLKTFGPSGNGADIFQFPHDQLAQAVLEDLVLPLPNSLKTSLEGRLAQLGLDIATLSFDETNGSFDPTSSNAVESLFAVPLSLESIVLYYNKDLVATPATTMEAILAAGATWNAALTSDATDDPTRTNAQAGYFYLGTTSHWADSYFMQPFYSAFGFTPFGANLDDPSAVGFVNTVAALNFFKDELRPIVTNGGATDSASGAANFEAGNIPYVIGGPWNHEAFLEAGINYGVAPMPTINGQNMRTFAGAMMTAVYKYSDNSEDAIKFVEFLTTDIAMELMYEYKTKLPALENSLLSTIPGVSEDELLLAMAEQLKTSVPMPTIPQVTYYWGPGETMIKDVWNNDVDPAVAAATAEASYRVRSGVFD